MVLVLVDVQLEVVDLFILEAGALEACDDRRKHPRNRPLVTRSEGTGPTRKGRWLHSTRCVWMKSRTAE